MIVWEEHSTRTVLTAVGVSVVCGVSEFIVNCSMFWALALWVYSG